MLISVLMSVYNGAETLDKAIQSILVQTLTDFEFIICDDASTDKSAGIIEHFAVRDPRIRFIRNEKNLGLGASLNRCLAVAQGQYIARQDADDISAADRLERTLDYLIRTDSPYVGCGVQVFDEGGIWNKRMFPEIITRHIIAQKNPFFHPTMIFKKEVIDSVGGYRPAPETRRTEDYDLVMRLAGKGIIGQNLQEYLYDVYEPMDAYSRHTLKTRWYEIVVRAKGLRTMKSPLRDYIYLAKPAIMAIIPRRLIKKVKQLQWKK